ncbi:SCO family protein [Phenylobacterium sp. LjRoot225]|uniref:SCO family protein n=1 Tax=Phenylobacterium sp. LjRoot225 TaxID=3342285 RepID=UPI003ECED7A7
MSRRLPVILALLAVTFAVLTGVAVWRGVLTPKSQTAAVGGPFQLVDQTRRKVDQTVLKGKWSAVFFGFTNCPDACPTTLFALGEAEKLLGPKAAEVQTIFISVDPARDTPERMATYLSTDAFPKRVLGLTGTAEQVAGVAKAYHIYYQRKAGEGDAYSVDHSTFTYLMNPKGRFVCVIPYNETPQQITARIQAAMAKGDKAESC